MGIMDDDNVRLKLDGPLAQIVVNRPKALNALNANVLHSISLALKEIQKDPDNRLVVISGEGDRAFVAGADIHSMKDLGPRALADYVELGQRVMREIELFPSPVVAAVHGFALGGGLELALACDLIYASSKARFGQPEVNLGIIPGFGGTQRLIHRCGTGAARQLIYSAEIINSDEALRLGLVDKVFAENEYEEKLKQSLDLILSKGSLAVKGAKQVIVRSQEALLLSGLRLEVEKFNELFATADREEGMEAFVQKREPKFTGR